MDEMDDLNKNINSMNLISENKQEESKTNDDACMQDHSVTTVITSDMKQMILYGNAEQQLIATQNIRKLLLNVRSIQIDEILKNEIVPRFVKFLESDNYQLQIEAALVLSDIISNHSMYIHCVIESGALPKFIKLLSSANENLQEQVIWALGRIIEINPEYRDRLLYYGILPPLLQISKEHCSGKIIKNLVWCLSNLCRIIRSTLEPSNFESALSTLVNLLYNPDKDVLAHACRAISYLAESSNDNENIQKIIESGSTKRLVELLAHDYLSVVRAALRAVGNLVTGNDIQTQVVIDCQALTYLFPLLSSTDMDIQREACWTVSNITAGNSTQIQAVLNANVFPRLIEILTNDDIRVKKEAVWALGSATFHGTQEQIRYLINLNVIPLFCEILLSPETTMVQAALEGLENILKLGFDESVSNNGINFYAIVIEKCGGLNKIKYLQSHEYTTISRISMQIVEKYFIQDELQN